FGNRFADTGQFFQSFFVLQIGQGSTPGLQRPRGVGIGADLERILILELEQCPNLLEGIDDFGLGHSSLTIREDWLCVDWANAGPKPAGATGPQCAILDAPNEADPRAR